jgi:NitT/TauT family transport system substrate-binding protein
MGKPLIEKAAGGKRAVALPYSDVMPDLYGNFLLTSDRTATEKPELVRKFIAALLKGLDYAIAHPAEAGQILHQAQPASNADVAAQELQIMASCTRSEAPVLGVIDSERVAGVITILTGTGEIPAGKRPEEFVTLSLAPKS